MNERKLRQLTELSKEARQLLTKMIGQIGVGHVGGSLSLIEALVYLYYEEMRVRPEEPGWPDRDRIVLSKGHAGPALYTLSLIHISRPRRRAGGKPGCRNGAYRRGAARPRKR